MCMQHQKPAKPQKKSFTTTDVQSRHIEFNPSLMEHGDPDFVDMRVKKMVKEKKGFFEKLFG